MSNMKIAVLGDLYVDIQTGPLNKMPDWNTALMVENIQVLLGGSAGNTARYLGSLEDDTRLFTVCGDDNLGKMALNQILAEGKVKVDESVVTIPKSSAPTVVVLYGPTKRSFIANQGALNYFKADVINKELLFTYDHLHFGGYFACLSLHSEEFLEVIKETKKNGLTISMDCQFDTKQEWIGANGHLAKLLPLLDVFMPSEYEAFGITKKNTVQESMMVLRKMMPNGLIIIKNGENGAFFSIPGKKEDAAINVPAFKVDKPADTTGAGDCFNAGFIHKWAQPKEQRRGKMENSNFIKNAISYGCAAAKFCVENVGAYAENFSKSDVDTLVLKN